LVAVKAAGLNPLDAKIHAGFMQDFMPVSFPYTLGTDFAGTVAALGEGVEGIALGDTVMGRSDPRRGGAVAAFLAVPLPDLAKASGASFADLAGLPTTAGTAFQALFEVGRLEAGQRVLIQGGAGGVGRYAVQMARHAGAEVVATASAGNADAVRRFGATTVVDYADARALAAIGEVDLALDTVGGDAIARTLDAVRPGGMLLSIPAPFDTSAAQAKGVRAQFIVHTTDRARLARIAAWLEAGVIAPRTDRALPPAEAASALAQIGARTSTGKTVVLFG